MWSWSPTSRARMRWGDFFSCEADWYWAVRDLTVLDVWLVTDGVGWISDEQRRTAISAGDCLLLRPGSSYEAGHDPERPLGLIAIHFDLLDEAGTPIAVPAAELPPFARRMEHPDLLRELLSRAVRSYKASEAGHRGGRLSGASDADAWLQAALMEVERQDRRAYPAGLAGERARRVEEICERVRRHPERDIRVEDIASELHVSPEHFSRLFRELVGLSPRAFITRTRIEAAQRLLLTSSLSIARVAQVLGYHTPYYFSRHFKAKVGLSPSAFRRGEREGA